MLEVIKYISLLANIFTIITAGIAIYLFIFKRKPISLLFKLLVNYSSQMTLSELKGKLERLNELRVTEPDHFDEVINIFHEILGQIKGNPRLSQHFELIVIEINETVSKRKYLTEPKKRALVSELREKLRNVNLDNIDSLLGEYSE